MSDLAAGDERCDDRPLPASRYRPGRGTRPERSPGGGFRHGVDLFNNGYWWEAHEAWEEVWMGLAPNSAERHGLQAMIQTANCFLKIAMGQAKAAAAIRADLARLFEAALLHRKDLAVDGLALGPWSRDVLHYVDGVLACGSPAEDPVGFPRIRLNP